jgi:hypothetical protein
MKEVKVGKLNGGGRWWKHNSPLKTNIYVVSFIKQNLNMGQWPKEKW